MSAFHPLPRIIRSALAGAVISAACAPVALAINKFGYVCNLEGIQETPPNGSPGAGTGIFIIDTVADTMSFRIEWGGFAETAAHIHGPAAPGAATGVVFVLPAGNPKVGVWAYPPALEADILAGNMYVNIHSAAFPGGEIRGQICTHVATLSGSQETPPVATPANGFGVFVMDPVNNILKFHIAFGGLLGVETAAHIHGLATHNVAAGVLFGLPSGSPKIGAIAYPEALEGAILAGLTYVNIHSAAFPGGEIRGQITNSLCTMQGIQEVPPNGSPAVGTGQFSHSLLTDTLGFWTRHAGLTAAETAAHIHGFAPRGAAAGVLFPLPAGTPKLGTWAHGAAAEPPVLTNLTYINIHTGTFPGGEIRGQIEPRFSCWADVNRDLQVDAGDIGPFVGCVISGTNCPCADTNFDGVVNAGDVPSFVDDLLQT